MFVVGFASIPFVLEMKWISGGSPLKVLKYSLAIFGQILSLVADEFNVEDED